MKLSKLQITIKKNLMNSKYTYQPDYAIHPGETLREKLEELQMSPKEFSIRTGKPIKTVSEILNSKSAITSEMAVQFEKLRTVASGSSVIKSTRLPYCS